MISCRFYCLFICSMHLHSIPKHGAIKICENYGLTIGIRSTTHTCRYLQHEVTVNGYLNDNLANTEKSMHMYTTHRSFSALSRLPWHSEFSTSHCSSFFSVSFTSSSSVSTKSVNFMFSSKYKRIYNIRQ